MDANVNFFKEAKTNVKRLTFALIALWTLASFLILASNTSTGMFEEITVYQIPKGHKVQSKPGDKMQWIRDHLSQACEVLKNKTAPGITTKSSKYLNSDLPMRILTSDQYKLIGCKITKVGSTNMARVMYTLDHLSETNNTNKVAKGKARRWTINTANDKDLTELRDKLKTYTTFMFVRDPVERLMSAYRDKRPVYWFKKKITFTKYLQMVLRTPDGMLNKHLISFNKLCKPCSTNYDFIGLLDNFEEDMRKILRSIAAEGRIVLPVRNKTGYKNKKSSIVMFHYRRNIPKDILKQIYEKYYVDYFLFGFPKPF